MAYQPPFNGGRINATISGNTAGNGSLISSGTMVLAGGNNITLSQATAATGNTISINAGAQSVQPGIQSIQVSNTTYTTGKVIFSNANNVSFGSSAGGAVTASISALGLNTAGTNVTWTVNSSGLSLNAGGYAGTGFSGTNASGTVNSNGLQLSVAAAAAAGSNTFGGSNLAGVQGNTGVVSGSDVQLLFAGGNNITLSQSLNGQSGTISVSAANQTVQPGIQSIQVSNTTYTTGNVIFSNANGVSFGSSAGGAVTASINALTSQSNQAVSGSNGSSTFQTLSFANSNGVSFGTGAGGLYASVQTNYLTTARASNDAIGTHTAGTNVTWTVNSSGLSLNAGGYAGTGTTFNGANISGSMTNNSVGLNLSLSAAAPGGGGVVLYDGTNSISSGTASFDNGGGVSFGFNGQTITASAPAGGGGGRTFSYWENLAPAPVSTVSNSSFLGTANGTMIVQPLSPYEGYQFGGNMTVNTMMLDLYASGSTTSSHSISVEVGFYTMVNSTQLSLVNSVASTWVRAANASNSRSYSGPRFLSFHSSQWSSQPVFSQDVIYWWGVFMRSSGTPPSMSWMGQWLGASNARWGTIGVSASAGNSGMNQAPFLGIYRSSTSAIPASIGASSISYSNVSAGFMPHLVFNNIASSF